MLAFDQDGTFTPSHIIWRHDGRSGPIDQMHPTSQALDLLPSNCTHAPWDGCDAFLLRNKQLTCMVKLSKACTSMWSHVLSQECTVS